MSLSTYSIRPVLDKRPLHLLSTKMYLRAQVGFHTFKSGQIARSTRQAYLAKCCRTSAGFPTKTTPFIFTSGLTITCDVGFFELTGESTGLRTVGLGEWLSRLASGMNCQAVFHSVCIISSAPKTISVDVHIFVSVCGNNVVLRHQKADAMRSSHLALA